MPTSHIQRQRSPAEFVDRPKVAEFHIRPGVERILRLKSTLSHFGRSSGGALWISRPAPVSTLTGVGAKLARHNFLMGGPGAGVLTPNFGRYVPRQSEKWGKGSGTSFRSSVKMWGSGTSLSRFELENAGLRNELEPF